MAYCTNRDLKDIYPSIDEFDTKTAIYGWTTLNSHSGSAVYQANNVGWINRM